MTGQAQRAEPDARRASPAIPPSTGRQGEQTQTTRRNRVAQPKPTYQIKYANLKDLFLDPRNPRLRQSTDGIHLPQEELYDRMKDWSLEELAISFLESGFWSHEAVLCVEEEIDGEEKLVVIEGNRRVAALRRLKRTYDGEETGRKWLELIKGTKEPDNLFKKIPYIQLNERGDADAFLGFRHVTGIKEWNPPQKARFIAKLIEEKGLSYSEVMRKIGSTTPTVERNYIAHCILRQMESVEDISLIRVEGRFSTLSSAIRIESVQNFLGIKEKFNIDPSDVMPPIDLNNLNHLKEFALWYFGDDERLPILKDSRDIDRLSVVLESDDALDYMRNAPKPRLEMAYTIAGGLREETIELLSNTSYGAQQALSTIHFYKDDPQILHISKLLISSVDQIRKTLEINEDA